MKIQIIDSGIGNILSVQNMLRKIRFKSDIVRKPNDNDYNLTILPGVGAFDNGIKRLNDLGWSSYLKNISNNKKHQILGICLGMQLLTSGSEEGNLSGLELIPGYFEKLGKKNQKTKVPHMGWNYVEFKKYKNYFWENSQDDPRFYFVHSYKYSYQDSSYIAGESTYEKENFASIIKLENITGFQFHPEKSHNYGMRLLHQFLSSCDY